MPLTRAFLTLDQSVGWSAQSQTPMAPKRLSGKLPKASPSRIAILGWGSLLKRPDELSIRGEWHNDGPRLPIEFARISKGGHLTLVIAPRRRLIRTYWALSGHNTLTDAIDNLANREGTSDLENIGYVNADGGQRARFPTYIPQLRAWMKRRSLHAVIWTDLEANFQEKREKKLTTKAAVDYLRARAPSVRAKAADYVQIAPPQSRTQLRPHLEKELGIKPRQTPRRRAKQTR